MQRYIPVNDTLQLLLCNFATVVRLQDITFDREQNYKHNTRGAIGLRRPIGWRWLWLAALQ